MPDQPNWERSIPHEASWGGCRVCRHFRLDMTCAAYPDRIPIVIASGEVDHCVVRPHQIGETVFEITQHPTGLALRFLEGAAKRGEQWAIDALANVQTSGAR